MTVKPKQTIAQNKLILLYLLRSGAMQFSELQLMRIASELTLMSYFDLKESLFELVQNDHATQIVTPNSILYEATENGLRIVDVMENDIRLSFREAIDSYLEKHRDALKKESQFVAEYIKLPNNEYRVILKVLEKNATVFEINVIVYSKDEAKTLIRNWKDNAVSLYKDILLRLS